jgi:HlyD family secretion protein
LASTNNSNGSPRQGPPRKGWNWLVAGLIAAAILVPVFSRRNPIRVRITTVERGPIRSLVSTNGKIEPVDNFEAHAPIATTVKRLLVKEGDRVRKGQLLLLLDDADIRKQAAQARAQMTNARADQNALTTGGTHEELLTLDSQLIKARSERDAAQRNVDAFHRLQQQGAASPGEVKQAEDTLRRAQADVTLLEQKQKDRYSKPEAAKVQAEGAEAQVAYEAATAALLKSNVRAPFSGIVYSLPVKEGSYVQSGDLLLQEADLSHVLVRIFVDEPDVGRLVPGQKIEVTWDAVPGRTWNGSVTTVPSTVKLRGARNVGESTCTVDNHDLKLLPNVNVGVTIVTAEHNNVLTLPRDAVRIDDTRPYVFQIVDNKLKRQDIDIALQNLTRVEITSGLPDKAVVALGTDDPKPMVEGSPVKVVP